MIERSCPRVWQAEAVLDGLLSQADRASFERHVATCAECGAERAALARLEQVAERMPSLTATALRRRALHNELLRRANERSVGGAQKQPAPRTLWVLFAASVLGIALAALVLLGRLPLGGSAEPSFQLLASPGARWHVAERGQSLRLALEAGTYTVFVEKLERGQRFLLNLPDGELEVRGTRFVVELERRRTLRVGVQEGRVALRLAGQPEALLSAGQAWPDVARAPAAEPAPASTSAPSTSSTVADERVIGRTGSSPSALPSPSPSAAAKAARTAKTANGPGAAVAEGGARSSAANDFADAMAVFSQGDFGTAERLFHLFEERYPKSPHVEDVLFLRALSRSRRGDEAGARALSQQYLRRYPHGFRANEAERMAREP